MKTPRILVGILALGLGLGACSDTPLLAPGAPSHGSGGTIGTGHRSDSTSVNTSATSSADSTSRNGSTFGTGH